MFKEDYCAEKSIKRIASIILLSAKVLIVLSFIAAFIILCIDAEYLWWISLIVVGGGLVLYYPTYTFAVLIWGFGDVVGNSKRMASSEVNESTKPSDTALPEL